MSYFDPWPIERTGELHRTLRTRGFRPFVAGGSFWQRLGLARPRRWSARQLESYVRQSKVVEGAHLASLVFLAAVSLWSAANQDWLAVVVLTLGNILLNLYPMLVARYNRHRIEKRLATAAATQVIPER